MLTRLNKKGEGREGGREGVKRKQTKLNREKLQGENEKVHTKGWKRKVEIIVTLFQDCNGVVLLLVLPLTNLPAKCYSVDGKPRLPPEFL